MSKKNKENKKQKKSKLKANNAHEKSSGIKDFWIRKKPILLYGLGFVFFILLFSWIGSQSFFDSIATPLLAFYTKLSSYVLAIFGLGVTASGDILGNNDFAIQVKKGCDAIAPMALYTIATLAFPVPARLKVRGILFGLAALFVLNIIRIVSLWLIGRFAPDMFDFAHVELWQVLFIAITVVLWLFWLRWAFSQTKVPTHENQQTT